ncbi:MAG: hypothetical protein Q8P20_09840 [bacterium]|nr:hypothetical protein [bacterium]
MTKNTKIILGAIIAIVIVGAAVIIAPNYRNEIADDSAIAVDTNDNRIYSEINTLRIEQDIDTYTKEAEAIVVGEFTRKGNVVWNSDKTDLSTETYFLVSDVLKGDIKPGEEIKILQWGGELDGQVQTYEGATRYNKGQTNLLFLGTNEDGEWGVFSGDWGQFPIDSEGMTQDFNDSSVNLSAFKDQIVERIK